MSFAELKRNRKSNFEKLNSELDKLASNNSYSDPIEEKLWKLDADKAGNGYAIIRFLPAPDGEDIPFIRIWDHGFQGPGGWYIEKSLTTLGENDPVGEDNSRLWNTGLESDKELARKRKRRLSYYSNIYVISDPKHPENEGKVFLFKYGKKIFDMLNDMMNPPESEFEQIDPVNPFDLWEGANFKLRRRIANEWPSYDKSEFETPGPLSDDEAKLEEIYNSMHPLKELHDRKYFKTYEELKTRFEKAVGTTSTPASSRRRVQEEKANDLPWDTSNEEAAPAFKESVADTISSIDEDDGLDMDFFRNVMEDE